MSHYLYLVRHGEHQDAEHGLRDGKLSERGKRQAMLVADRLGGVPFDGVYHSPLDAPSETAAFSASSDWRAACALAADTSSSSVGFAGVGIAAAASSASSASSS